MKQEVGTEGQPVLVEHVVNRQSYVEDIVDREKHVVDKQSCVE